MKAFEYYAEISADGQLPIPEDLRAQLSDSEVRVMLFVDDEEAIKDRLANSEFLEDCTEKGSILDTL